MPPKVSQRTATVKRSTDGHTTRNYAPIWEEFGSVFIPNCDPVNLCAESCPFCGGEKFYLNIEKGVYECKRASCGQTGNHIIYLTWLHADLLKKTTTAARSKLAQQRGIPSQTLHRHELAFDDGSGEDRWLLPFKNRQGNVVTIQLYYPDRKKPNKFNLPGLPTGIFNLHKLSADKSKLVYLCEGVFDALALDYAIGDKHRSRYDIVATPGGMKAGWEEHFQGRKVRALYHNDEGGEKHRKKVQKLLGESRIADDLLMLKWPEGTPDGYDINDFVKEHRQHSIVSFINDHSFRFVPEPLLAWANGWERDPAITEQIDWPWPNRLRCGSYCSLSGRQKTLKSTLMREIVAMSTRGDPLPGCEEVGLPAGHVIYISAEDSVATVYTSLTLAKADMNHVTVLPATLKDGDPMNILDHMEELRQRIRQYAVRLVVIDGQNSVVGAPCIVTDMLARHNITNKLHQFAQRENVCLVGIRNEDSEGRAYGPASMGDLARCVLRAVELQPLNGERYFELIFDKVSDAAPSTHPTLPYSVEDLGGSSRRILWGKIPPEQGAVNNIANRLGG